jgi:hypothetical protein
VLSNSLELCIVRATTESAPNWTFKMDYGFVTVELGLSRNVAGVADRRTHIRSDACHRIESLQLNHGFETSLSRKEIVSPFSHTCFCGAFVYLKSFVIKPSLPLFGVPTELGACRTNAKKEKIKRNRENMRKFSSGSTGGRRGTSRRKLLKKVLSTKARQEESEFIANCFTTVPAPGVVADTKK